MGARDNKARPSAAGGGELYTVYRWRGGVAPWVAPTERSWQLATYIIPVHSTVHRLARHTYLHTVIDTVRWLFGWFGVCALCHSCVAPVSGAVFIQLLSLNPFLPLVLWHRTRKINF